jgi:hypothetical protein
VAAQAALDEGEEIFAQIGSGPDSDFGRKLAKLRLALAAKS